jgi:hypothetical protein
MEFNKPRSEDSARVIQPAGKPHVQIRTGAKGEALVEVKIYDDDPRQAGEMASRIYQRLRDYHNPPQKPEPVVMHWDIAFSMILDVTAFLKEQSGEIGALDVAQGCEFGRYLETLQQVWKGFVAECQKAEFEKP